MLPTASEAIGRLGAHEAYIAYLPLAHVLELLAENTMLVLGVPIGYATANTLLDSSTMVARGCKVG
jgi:long-chain acyl-CoA synthetase